MPNKEVISVLVSLEMSMPFATSLSFVTGAKALISASASSLALVASCSSATVITAIDWSTQTQAYFSVCPNVSHHFERHHVV
jgi:hypothetical protein